MTNAEKASRVLASVAEQKPDSVTDAMALALAEAGLLAPDPKPRYGGVHGEGPSNDPAVGRTLNGTIWRDGAVAVFRSTNATRPGEFAAVLDALNALDDAS